MARATHFDSQPHFNRPIYFATATLLSTVLLSALLSTQAVAGGWRSYEVTITNLTRAQVLTPPVAIAHRSGFELFEIGGTPSDGLAVLAKDGVVDDLVSELDGDPDVIASAVGAGPVLPGHSLSLMLRARHHDLRFSLVGMLASSNDAIFALRGVPAPRRSLTQDAAVYDAAAEANSESCDDIPGPPCGQEFASPADDPEDFIHIHNGIHGIADLDPAELDWRGPAARVTVRRVR